MIVGLFCQAGKEGVEDGVGEGPGGEFLVGPSTKPAISPHPSLIFALSDANNQPEGKGMEPTS